MVFLGGCEPPEERARDYVKRGVALFEAGDPDRARVEFANATRIDATNGLPFYYIGRIHEAKKEWRPAFGAYLRAVQQSPDHVDANLRVGRIYLMAGNFDQALSHAEKAVSLEPDNADALALRAGVSLRQKKLDQAKADADRALELDPANSNARAVLVGYYRERKDTLSALDVLEAGIARNPKEPAFQVMKVALHVERKEPAQVEEGLRALVKLDPANANYRLTLARFYVSQRKPDAAQAVLKEAIELYPEDTQAKLRYVVFLANQRGVASAEYTLKEFMSEAKDDDYTFHMSLADLYRRNNRRDEAKAVLEQTVASAGDKPAGLKAKVGLAQFRFQDKDADGALVLLNEVLAKEDKNGPALLTRATILLQQRQFKESILDLRTYLREDPQSRQALGLLSQAYMTSRQADLAVDTMQRLISVDPGNDKVRLRLAQLLARKGQREAAIKLLNDGLARKPKELAFLTTKADIQIALKRFEKARSVIEAVRQLPETKVVVLRLEARLAIAERRFGDAAAALQRVLEMAPNSEKVASDLARVHLVMKRADRAEAVLRTFTERNPESALAKLLLGDVLAQQNKFDAAIAVYSGIADDTKVGSGPILRLARVYQRLEKPDKSIEALRHGLKKNPENWTLAVLLALTLQREKQYDEALALYGKMVEQRPRSTFAVNNYAALVADHKFGDKTALQRAIKVIGPFQATEDPFVLDTIGWLQMRNDAASEAVVYLRRAVDLAPDHPVINYHLAVAYKAIGKPKEARTHLEKALESGKAFDEAEKARALLAELPGGGSTPQR